MKKNLIIVSIVKDGVATGDQILFETKENTTICKHCDSINLDQRHIGQNDSYQIRCNDCGKLVCMLLPKKRGKDKDIREWLTSNG